MKQFKDKTAIVTGGAAGIGRGLCEELARAGAVVVIADIDEEGAQKAAQEIRSSGGRAIGKRLDVTRDEEIEKVVDETIEEYGRLDYMFNNAGIAVGGGVHEHSLDDWNHQLDVNVRGVVHGVQAAYPVFREQGFGHLVNTASMAGLNRERLPASHHASGVPNTSNTSVVTLDSASDNQSGPRSGKSLLRLVSE